tara:strand:- start:19 stop:642 length:624 start_codon:yes stop_codon:yes gene_type:complete
MEEVLRFFPDLSLIQQNQFKQLQSLYEEWNEKINVISRKDMEHFYTHHVLHALAIAKVINFKDGTSILDVGTGGGFPAVPLAILFPNCRFLAVDSIGKKITVVNAVKESLELRNLEAKHLRAEEIDYTFDFIVSRAVTRAAKFISWVDELFNEDSKNTLKNGFIFLKGGALDEEMKETGRKFKIHSISDFFDDPFFETKKVVYVPSK